MPTSGLRFLLDQNFPNPKLPVEELQTNVEYVHLSSHAPALSTASTPDWMLYLVAEAGGFDGVVTKDFRQVEQPEELVALTRLKVSVVTWKTGLDDPVTAWALLVAYMPEIEKAIATQGPRIFLLPVPRLKPATNVLRASSIARELAKKSWDTSYGEQSASSLEIMREELRHRGRVDLAGLLDRKEIREPSERKRASRPRTAASDSDSQDDQLFTSPDKGRDAGWRSEHDA